MPLKNNFSPWYCSLQLRAAIPVSTFNPVCYYLYNFFPFIFISWRLITLQYCSGFCHTLTWISHGFTCVPHPDPPSHLPLHPIPLGQPSVPALNTSLMHPTWAGDQFHPWYYTCFNAILSYIIFYVYFDMKDFGKHFEDKKKWWNRLFWNNTLAFV